jgi:hypothetical protein
MPSSKTADWNIEGHMTRATIVKIAVHRCRRCEPTGDGGWGTQWQLNLNAGFAIPLRRQLTLGLTCKVGRFAYCDFSPRPQCFFIRVGRLQERQREFDCEQCILGSDTAIYGR